MFNQAYTAVTNSLKLGAWYVEVNMDSGLVVWPTFSSLQCFWPGMQALIGDLDAAAETMEAFYRMWNVYGAVPEGFNLLKEASASRATRCGRSWQRVRCTCTRRRTTRSI